jgi:hypothetical protein
MNADRPMWGVMDRRHWGIVLLTVVLVLAIVAPVWVGVGFWDQRE